MNIKRRITTLLLAWLVAGLASANAGTLLTGAVIVDVIDGKTIRGQVVAVRDGTITYVGPMAGLPDGDWTEVDLGGATLLPGLSDSHVHLTSGPEWHGLRRLTLSTPRAAINGVVNARKTLMAGFTTVRNLGAPGFADIDLMKAIDAMYVLCSANSVW